jgi:xylan 1,4-beta-xylosidase
MTSHRDRRRLVIVCLALAGVLSAGSAARLSTARAAGQATRASRPTRAAPFMTHWTADNGNGTYSNPLFYEEFEDPDVIRVGGDYYLAGTTMHMNPGVQIMHSRDLVNWELAGYAIDRLDLGPAYRLEGGNIYGRDIWAPCIRYHQGMFYIFSNVNGAGLQVFRSTSIHGPWERNQLPGRHDLSVLFDDDLGKIFIISGARAPYPIEELAPDLRSFVPGVHHELVVPDGQRMGEGHHLYKIKGRYYDVSAIPGGTVDQMVASADSIDGPWTVDRMVQGESLGVPTVTPVRATPDDRGLTLHQGGIVDTPSGEWWSIIMSDHGSAGRMVALVPITWDNGFPLIGLPGNLRKAPNTWIKPNTGFTQAPTPAFVHDDTFDGTLNPLWQWNHVPDDAKWSLTEKPGVLRLHALAADDFYDARNSISQRPPAPESIMTVALDSSGLVPGDTAGLGLISTPYAWIGVVSTSEGTSLQMVTGAAPGRRSGAATPVAASVMGPVNPPAHVWLRVHCNFDTDQAVFSWSADGRTFTPLGDPFTMKFQLTTFQGVRPALFNFNTSGQRGGYADFDNYAVDEPRARGIERQIPMGRIIALTSGADGRVLVADTRNNVLVGAAPGAAGAIPQNARFQVMDVGLGRVALKAVNGRFVSVHGARATLEDLGRARPGTAESFQWVNLMRGDTMLMSLTNHRYLATTPNATGPVTVTALGATAARKSGAEFTWRVVAGQAAGR